MAKKINTGQIFLKLKDGRSITIEKNEYNMGKRREIFSIEVKGRFSNQSISNLTIEEIEEIIKSAKMLNDALKE